MLKELTLSWFVEEGRMVDLNLLQNEARQRHEGNAEPMVQRQIGFNKTTRTIGLHMKSPTKAAEALMTPTSLPGIPYTSNPWVAFSALEHTLRNHKKVEPPEDVSCDMATHVVSVKFV